MRIKILTVFAFLFVCSSIQAQLPDQFPEDLSGFIKVAGAFIDGSENKDAKKTFDYLEEQLKTGVFTEEELPQIVKTANAMLGKGMSANPNFKDYFQTLSMVKNTDKGATRFKEWHVILDGLIADMDKRKTKPYLNFLKFSKSYFQDKTLRASTTGINWLAIADKAELKYINKEPLIEFKEVDLLGTRKADSIFINETAGTYYPTQQKWTGQGGKVTWERFGLDAEVYAALTDYEIDCTKSLYEAEKVTLHYPAYFGTKNIEGSFTDKLVVSNQATEGSYPRFVSYQDILKIDKIGQGIEYEGGFILQGTTVYGVGTKEKPALVELYDEQKQKAFRGLARTFVIRRGERIVGEQVESTVYFKEDSLYHPSVNVRFEINDKILKLTRGERASDRNPFYASQHDINIDAEKVTYLMQSDSVLIGDRGISPTRQEGEVIFESTGYFSMNDYQKFQNIGSYNPINTIKALCEKDGVTDLDANYLASRINSKFTVDNIKNLLYDLVKQGFINYDYEENRVYVKEKVFHYTNASQKKVDFDALKIKSTSKETNAVLNLKDNTIATNGVSRVELSEKQKVAIDPYGDVITMSDDRSIDFNGRLFAGFGLFQGKDFYFDYGKFSVTLDSCRYFDLYIPTGAEDERGTKEALSLASRIEHVNGVLLIDAPKNKSGKDDIAMFPSIQTKEDSYVYYDYMNTIGGVYRRDSFYFKIRPFSFNSLDNFVAEEVKFKGELVSSKIFPDFKETLVIREEDQSLGFIHTTPTTGYPNYEGKGSYRGDIDLSNKGMFGVGIVTYLGANILSEDIVFRPKQLTASAKLFDLEENRGSGVEVPQVAGVDVKIDWRPYRDSMYVRSEKAPFDIYNDGIHTLKGTIVLTPTGVKGKGLFDWGKANMNSQLFAFGAHDVQADTANLKIRAFDADAIALETSNLNADVNFDTQKGKFKANAELLRTTLPYNQYETSFNEFDWNMKEETITFKAKPGSMGNFLSIHPDQDSLFFQGEAAKYDLRTNLLNITGVEEIVSADAFIYTEDGKVEVQKGGVVTQLKNAKIVADTTTKHHIINRATVDLLGKKDFKATGFYEYNLKGRDQEIEFQEILGARIGKGSRDSKKTATRATGIVDEKSKFYIDEKTEFRGTISLSSEKKELSFDGFAYLDCNLPARHWFTVNFEGDKEDLKIRYEVPKNYEGAQLRTGIYLSKETARIYPRVMSPLYYRKDRPLLPATGLFDYDPIKDQFVFGDSIKVTNRETLKGNIIVFDNKSGKVRGEGKIDIGSGLDYISVDAAGSLELGAAVATDSIVGGPMNNEDLEAEIMSGVKIIIPERLMKIMANDVKSASFDASAILFQKDFGFYQKAISELIPDKKAVTDILSTLSPTDMAIPKKYNPYTFLFGKTEMKWDPDYQSFVNKSKNVPLIAIDGEVINKTLTIYMEYKMPTNDDDRVYIYVKSPSEFYYFFGYQGGVLNVVSNNPKFNDEIINMKSKEAIIKMEDGETYEIAPVEPGSATRFLNRIKAVQ